MDLVYYPANDHDDIVVKLEYSEGHMNGALFSNVVGDYFGDWYKRIDLSLQPSTGSMDYCTLVVPCTQSTAG